MFLESLLNPNPIHLSHLCTVDIGEILHVRYVECYSVYAIKSYKSSYHTNSTILSIYWVISSFAIMREEYGSNWHLQFFLIS